MHFPIPVRFWPKTPFDAGLRARLALARKLIGEQIASALHWPRTQTPLLLSRTRAPLNVDWILGSLGWTALVYAIVHFGGVMT